MNGRTVGATAPTLRPRVAALAVLVALALASACSPGLEAGHSTAPSRVLTEVGIQPALLSTPELSALLDRFRADRIQVVSTVVNWNAVRPQAPPAPYQWRDLDTLVRLALERGLRVRLRVASTPPWLHPNLAGVGDADVSWYPPTGQQELDEWSGFLTDLTTRYASRLSAIEIWNEPNESDFWRPAPDPAAYASLLRASYLAIKRVAPRLTVAFGGLSHNDLGYLSAFYDAAAAYPDAPDHHWYFDQLDIHPYSSDRSPDARGPDTRYWGRFGVVDESFTGMHSMVALVEQREGVHKHVWIGEFGYSTDSTPWVPGIPDRRRAYFLTRAFAIAEASGYVDGLGWYDVLPSPYDAPGYEILTPQGPTETYAALTRVTGAKPATSPLRLHLPALTGRGVESITADAAGLGAATHMELYVDGRLVAAGAASIQWDTRATPAGTHAIQLVAWSPDGATHTSPIRTVSIEH